MSVWTWDWAEDQSLWGGASDRKCGSRLLGRQLSLLEVHIQAALCKMPVILTSHWKPLAHTGVMERWGTSEGTRELSWRKGKVQWTRNPAVESDPCPSTYSLQAIYAETIKTESPDP